MVSRVYVVCGPKLQLRKKNSKLELQATIFLNTKIYKNMKKQIWLAAFAFALVAVFAACNKESNATFLDLTTSH